MVAVGSAGDGGGGWPRMSKEIGAAGTEIKVMVDSEYSVGKKGRCNNSEQRRSQHSEVAVSPSTATLVDSGRRSQPKLKASIGALAGLLRSFTAH